mmetsp:Transcript_145020/g.255648  ORF Transcript_145020/g.255648 Transcript_145020/m.255648 type:complete len:516 (+) Transcript_145020:133-1680(+)
MWSILGGLLLACVACSSDGHRACETCERRPGGWSEKHAKQLQGKSQSFLSKPHVPAALLRVAGASRPLSALTRMFFAFNLPAGQQIFGSGQGLAGDNVEAQSRQKNPLRLQAASQLFLPKLASVRMSAQEIKDETGDSTVEVSSSTVLKTLPKVAGAGVVGVLLLHAPAFAQFVAQWQAIGAAGVSGNDFWAPLQFWAFFAAMHPLLQPAVWIGEVLHGSPGPQLANVMPFSFIALNIAVLGGLSAFAELRTALNLGLLALFINYIGVGLEGGKDMSDFNLALDDGVKGCPTYEQVRQPSMQDFDVKKYVGRWYEHGFHDWTQFGEVYDTTLDIELSKDGSRWLDDFAVRGPAPKAAPLSWDKSPVANGANYFLYGKLNPATPGVLQESGFGVTFPNYIVDVQKDANGQYKEAIQFQCLQRGGVRIFEGINFLSRDPEMTPAARAAMFERASKAGMAPYGATPEQMHEVPHRPPGMEPIENSWQGLWRSIGFDKLLGLVESSTHSAFEDTTGLGS